MCLSEFLFTSPAKSNLPGPRNWGEAAETGHELFEYILLLSYINAMNSSRSSLVDLEATVSVTGIETRRLAMRFAEDFSAPSIDGKRAPNPGKVAHLQRILNFFILFYTMFALPYDVISINLGFRWQGNLSLRFIGFNILRLVSISFFF